MFEAHSINRIEVSVHISTDKIRRRLKGLPLRVAAGQLPDRHFLQRLKLKAKLRSGQLGVDGSWEANFERFGETLDPGTRTLSVVASVKRDFQQALNDVGPPLFPGMYMEVEISGMPRQGRAIPRSALHNDELYIVDLAQQLRRQKVELGYVQGDLAVVASGLEGGLR